MRYRDMMMMTAAIAFSCGVLFALGPPSFIPYFNFYEAKFPMVLPLKSLPVPPHWITYAMGRTLGGAIGSPGGEGYAVLSAQSRPATG